jgi:hypothetical protein
MVELIHLINDISAAVKLGWVGVLVWGVVQFVWYQRGRVLPEDMDVEPASEGWSVARLLALFKRSSDDAEEGVPARPRLSIAPAFDPPIHDTSGHEAADLGAAAGVALESLLDADNDDRTGDREDAEALAARKKDVSHQSSMSY